MTTAASLIQKNLFETSSERLDNLTQSVLNRKCSLYGAAKVLVEGK
jgi:hypothetical protein